MPVDACILDDDVLLRIVELTRLEDLFRLELTCKQMKALISTRGMWISRMQALDFDCAPDIAPHVDLANLSTDLIRSLVVRAVLSYRNWHSPTGPKASKSCLTLVPRYAILPFFVFNTMSLLPGVCGSRSIFTVVEATATLGLPYAMFSSTFPKAVSHEIATDDDDYDTLDMQIPMSHFFRKIACDAVDEDKVRVAVMRRRVDGILAIDIMEHSRQELESSRTLPSAESVKIASRTLLSVDGDIVQLHISGQYIVLCVGSLGPPTRTRTVYVFNWRTEVCIRTNQRMEQITFVDDCLVCCCVSEGAPGHEDSYVLSCTSLTGLFSRHQHTTRAPGGIVVVESKDFHSAQLPIKSPVSSHTIESIVLSIASSKTWSPHKGTRIALILRLGRIEERDFTLEVALQYCILHGNIAQDIALDLQYASGVVLVDKTPSFVAYFPICVSRSGRVVVSILNSRFREYTDVICLSLSSLKYSDEHDHPVVKHERRIAGAFNMHMESYSGALCYVTKDGHVVEWYD